MALSDLTSRPAVLEAIAEFQQIGQTAFLNKYGFGPAREYFLLYEGQSFDSKAIVGAAHGFQHPNLGPLKPAEFKGGALETAAKLRELGFEVVPQSVLPKPGGPALP